MKNKSASHLILTGLFAVLVLAASNSIVRAQECPGTTTWTGGIGDWFAGTNWNNGCVPNATIDASVNNGGHAQIGGDVEAIAKSLRLGDNQGQSGSVTVDGASAVLDLGSTSSCRGDIYIGNRGSGTLTIANGGEVWNRYAYVAAVANPTRPASNGYVDVRGFGTRWAIVDSASGGCIGARLFIGCTATSDTGGTAVVNVSGGGRITVLNRDEAPGAPGVKVGLSGTLTGNGDVILTGTGLMPNFLSVTVSVLGTLAPKGGELEIRGNLDLELSANTVCHVTPQAWDSVIVRQDLGGGKANLGGRLTVIMTGSGFTSGTLFTLLHAEAGRGTTMFDFESIMPPGGGGPCFTPIITYDENNVFLYLQPCD